MIYFFYYVKIDKINSLGLLNFLMRLNEKEINFIFKIRF